MKVLKLSIFMALISFSIYIPGPSYADHSWSDYHWASISKPVTLQLIDSVTDDWDYQLVEAISQRSQSMVLNPAITAYDNKVKTRKNCALVTGKLRVCN